MRRLRFAHLIFAALVAALAFLVGRYVYRHAIRGEPIEYHGPRMP